MNDASLKIKNPDSPGDAKGTRHSDVMAERRDMLRISVTAHEAVEIESGLLLPPGTYSGTRTRIGVVLGGSTSWTGPRYKIELTGLQLADMGVPNTDHQVTIDSTSRRWSMPES